MKCISMIDGKFIEQSGIYSRNDIHPIPIDGILNLDFDDKDELIATKDLGGSIIINENITIAYNNNSNFKCAWMTIEVTGATRTITFPASHKSGDSRWSSSLLTLTLDVGLYQISVMNNKSYKSILCSQIEI